MQLICSYKAKGIFGGKGLTKNLRNKLQGLGERFSCRENISHRLSSSWWFQPIWKNIIQIGSSPQVGVKIYIYI